VCSCKGSLKGIEGSCSVSSSASETSADEGMYPVSNVQDSKLSSSGMPLSIILGVSNSKSLCNTCRGMNAINIVVFQISADVTRAFPQSDHSLQSIQRGIKILESAQHDGFSNSWHPCGASSSTVHVSTQKSTCWTNLSAPLKYKTEA